MAIARMRAHAWPIVSGCIVAFRRQPVTMLARQAAYSLLYALPAMIALIVFLAAMVDRYTNTGLSTLLQHAIDERAPDELQDVLDSLVQHAIAEQDGRTAAIGVIVSLGVGLWGGAGGVGALIYSCNRVYDIPDTRSYVARRLLALVLTFAGGAMVIVAIFLVLLGERVGAWIAEQRGQGSSAIDALLSSRLTPALLLFIAVMMLYLFAPDVPHSAWLVLPGAVLATVATMVSFVAFDFVVSLIDPGSAFGAAGSVLVLLWLLDLVSIIVVSGAVINAVLSDRYDSRMASYLERHPERRVPPRAY